MTVVRLPAQSSSIHIAVSWLLIEVLLPEALWVFFSWLSWCDFFPNLRLGADAQSQSYPQQPEPLGHTGGNNKQHLSLSCPISTAETCGVRTNGRRL